MTYEYDDYFEFYEVGERQQPKLTPEEQKQWYWAEKEFRYFQRLMIPSWITHKHNDMYT